MLIGLSLRAENPEIPPYSETRPIAQLRESALESVRSCFGTIRGENWRIAAILQSGCVALGWVLEHYGHIRAILRDQLDFSSTEGPDCPLDEI